MTMDSERNVDAGTQFERLLELDASTCSVHVCVGSYLSDDDIPQFQSLQLSNSLSHEFRSVVTGVLESLRRERRLRNLVLRPYTDATKWSIR